METGMGTFFEIAGCYHRYHCPLSRTVFLGKPNQATLRLACTASLAPYLASRALAQVFEKVPRLQCRVRVLGPDVLNDHLLQRESHLGIALGPHDHPNLERVKSYRCGLACVMRTGHPLAAKKRIAPKDLVGERVISSPESTPFGQTLKRAFGEHGAGMHKDLDCTSSTTACWFAQAGVGVAVVDQASIAGGVLAG